MEAGRLALEAVGGLIAWLVLGFVLARRAGRPFADHGFGRHHAARRLLIGVGLALMSLGASLALSRLADGTARPLSFRPGQWVSALPAFAALSLVALAQEGVCRGWLLTGLARRAGAPAAITLTSLAFAALHLALPGVTGLFMLNMFAFGVALAIWAMREATLWGPIGFHAAWNVGLYLLMGEGPGGREGGFPTLLALLAVLAVQAWLWRRDATSR
jgi:membrane protease YdiL (CAAX protease family)